MKTLRIHYLQHVHFEDLGCIEDWAKTKVHRLSSTKFYENESLPELSEFDWLIVMGGPMGVYDFEKYNWLSGEKEFIGNAIRAKKTVIGICLGAQLIASALGAKVYPNTEKEIGWFPISPTKETIATNLLGKNEDSFPVFHWHGDTFDLPPDATRIASSEICLNQAFVYAEKVIGLQFHFEVTEKSLQRMISFCSDELVDGKHIQSEEEIISNKRLISGINGQMFRLLDRMEEI
ncbi:MAG TPA: type 1 glutamine amidotransferase [Prolixibacteraceae bacterium]|nr:type 1 glutamine amidotransferase [Prolixibacteraceae bacterium]